MNTVKCDYCGLEFEPENSDAEAIEEFEHLFPGEKFIPEEAATLCESCFQKFQSWMRSGRIQLDN